MDNILYNKLSGLSGYWSFFWFNSRPLNMIFFFFCNGVTSMQVIPLFITSNKSTNPTVSILSQCLNEVVWFLQENKQSPYKIRVMLADAVYIQCHLLFQLSLEYLH